MDKIAALVAKEIESAADKFPQYATPGRLKDADLDRWQRALGVTLPPDLRRYLTSLGIKAGDAELVLGRMSRLLLVSPWSKLLDSIGGGDRALTKALHARRLLPLGDDYSGHFWVCVDLAHQKADDDAPLVELNLESDFAEVADDVDAFVTKFGSTFATSAEAIVKRNL